ncbi:hypothetical protein RhiirA4_73031 [Rhizophagus irregularis]|uniref:Uncharacterized protein n=1 Tax=Rhizophagus irregularis TaxID=588596 RepID=A0A2I1G5Z8_9GLOM|nr:hypothetical protein RhiirA4_73031 [Rhizophagus irregularis]
MKKGKFKKQNKKTLICIVAFLLSTKRSYLLFVSFIIFIIYDQIAYKNTNAN